MLQWHCDILRERFSFWCKVGKRYPQHPWWTSKLSKTGRFSSLVFRWWQVPSITVTTAPGHQFVRPLSYNWEPLCQMSRWLQPITNDFHFSSFSTPTSSVFNVRYIILYFYKGINKIISVASLSNENLTKQY